MFCSPAAYDEGHHNLQDRVGNYQELRSCSQDRCPQDERQEQQGRQDERQRQERHDERQQQERQEQQDARRGRLLEG